MIKSKKLEDGAMSTSCGIIVFFLIYGQFAAIGKPDSRWMVYKV